jgi:hypothetical protein
MVELELFLTGELEAGLQQQQLWMVKLLLTVEVELLLKEEVELLLMVEVELLLKQELQLELLVMVLLLTV